MILSKQEFLDYLSQLQLSPVEAAQLLSVTPRTVHRWLENPHEISGSAAQALRAWISLKNYNLPWRPDCINLPWRPDCINLPWLSEAEVADQIAQYRNHHVFVSEVIEKVKKRGSLLLPWQIDLDRGSVKLEKTIEVFFGKLHGKNLSLFGYRRIDNQSADIEHNQYLIEEAIFAIHEKLATLLKKRN